MNIPEVQNDSLINKLTSKAELFLPNVILYFERDAFLMRRNNFEINHSAKSFPNFGGNYSPHFDSFDIAPMRTIRAGQTTSEFQFSIRDYQLKMLKGWFIWLIPTNKEKDAKEKGENPGFWLFFMNEQFYFYYPHQDKISFSNATGELSLNGKFVVYRSDDQTITKYSLSPNPKDSEFQHFINNCFRVIASKPMDSFIKSFKANKEYPEVNEETASFYRYFFQNPTFLLTIGIDPHPTNSIKDLTDIFIKSINEKIFSIAAVLFFDIFRTKGWKNAYQQKYLLYNVIRTLASKDEEFCEAKKILSKTEGSDEIDYKKLRPMPIGSFAAHIMASLYQVATAVELDPKTELIEALVTFYLYVLFEIPINNNDDSYVTEENVEFCSSFQEPAEYFYTLNGPLNEDEIHMIINEIVQNIDHYVDLFNSSNASTLVENLNSFLNPANQSLKGSKQLSASSSILQASKPSSKSPVPDSLPVTGVTRAKTRSPKPQIAKQNSVPSSLKKTPPLPLPPKSSEKPPIPASPPTSSNTSSDETISMSHQDSPDGERIDPHLFDSFPYNIPPPRQKPDASSFLMPPQEGEEETGSSILAGEPASNSTEESILSVEPSKLEELISPVAEEKPENSNSTENNPSDNSQEIKEDKSEEESINKNDNLVVANDIPKEDSEKEKKIKSDENKDKIEDKKKEKEEDDDKKKETDKNKDNAEKKDKDKYKKKKDNDDSSDTLSSDDDSSYSSLSSTLSDDDGDDDLSDDSSLSSSSSSSAKKSKVAVLKAAPRYDGTEEPPLEERDESDTTIQDDAM